jgi:quercetin dioxygenase-like cupin family protein
VQALRQVLHHERAGVAALVTVAAAEGRVVRRHRHPDDATTAPAGGA